MSINITIPVLLLILSLFQYSNAANHFVGGPDGSWDMITDFQSWSSSKKFFIGDTLTFQYMAGVHNVFEVTESDYDTCTGTNPIMKDSSGSTVVKLNSSGKRYFICEIPGHCVSGMKVSVNVLTSDKSSAPPPVAHDDSSPTPKASTSPPPTETNLPPPLPSTPPPSTTSSPPPSISPVSSSPPSSSPPPSISPVSSSPPSSSPPSSSSPESSSPSPASSMAPEPSTAPPPSPSTMPSESPSTTSPTGSTTEDQPSLASKTSVSFQYVIGLILGFTILFHVC